MGHPFCTRLSDNCVGRVERGRKKISHTVLFTKFLLDWLIFFCLLFVFHFFSIGVSLLYNVLVSAV